MPLPTCAMQASEAAIEKVVECLAEDIPMPQCALSLSAVELLGGVLCDAAEPMGYRDGGWPPL